MSEFQWVPEQAYTAEGKLRRVGVELEFAGLTPTTIVDAIIGIFGGDGERITRFEYVIRNTVAGDFILELDANLLKSIAKKEQQYQWPVDSLEGMSIDLLSQAGEKLVPWEVVSPPIPMASLGEMNTLVESLRNLGALGTRHSFVYAFGLHLNQELPDTSCDTLLRYFRSYLCLYDWIAKREKIDLSRKLTFYIEHFSLDYIKHVIQPDYAPNLEQLIDDYLSFNPTRNRSLDLLPLFSYLDKKRVRRLINDPRIKARPTFHYRLPNCDIDNPQWNLQLPWSLWIQVESLANDPERLKAACNDYFRAVQRFTYSLDDHWLQRVERYLDNNYQYPRTQK